MTTRTITPVGFKVARVDLEAGRVVDFAVNRLAGPASKLPHHGFERPSHRQFGPDGALYVVDWGEIQLAPEVGGVRMRQGTGVLWRIRRTSGPAGQLPPRPLVVPAYGLRASPSRSPVRLGSRPPLSPGGHAADGSARAPRQDRWQRAGIS